jgi:DNA invertase Pin-like site-specific DNA recombinase
MRAAIYARVSTFDQEPENQLAELRRYVEARAWSATEYVDRGVSGAKDRRPALDDVIRDAKRDGSMCSCAGALIASDGISST